MYLEILEPVIKSNIYYVSMRERERKRELETAYEIALGNIEGNEHLKVT